MTYDTVVIGAGLAGSGVACGLAQRGRKVLLVERRAQAQHKVCGEFLSPEAQHSFGELGLYDAVQRLKPAAMYAARFVSRRGVSLAVELPGTAWGVSRYALDGALAHAAAHAGAELLAGASVTDTRETAAGYTLAIRDRGGLRDVHTRTVVAACGRHPLPTLRPPASPARHSYVGVKCHYGGISIGPEVQIYLFDGGYAGLGRIENGNTNVCLLVTRAAFVRAGGSVEHMIAAAAQRNRRLAAVLQSGLPLVETACSVAPVDTERAATPWHGYPRVGDAASMIPPLCGDGMAMALRCAELCVDATDDYLAGRTSRGVWREQYVAAWNGEFRSRLHTGRRLQRALNTPLLNDLLLGLGNWMPAAARGLVRATRGAVVPG